MRKSQQRIDCARLGRRAGGLALGAALGLVPSTSRAAAPCAEASESASLGPLVKALRGPETWAEALKQVPPAPPGTPPDAAPDRACRHYLAGAAAFFLSERAPEYAPRAVEQLLSARLLAPESMEHVQARARLKTAFSRIGDVPGLQPRGALAAVVVDPTGPALGFVLQPLRADTPRWQLPAPAKGASLLLPPGEYRATVNGRCGGSDIHFTVAGGTGRIVLPAAPPCLVRLSPVGPDGAAVSGFRVRGPEGAILTGEAFADVLGTLSVEAPGHLPTSVALDGPAGVRVVTLQRCPVRLDVTARPADARITGAGPGPWGRRVVTLTRAGYRPATLTADVPSPADCTDAHHAVEATLDRPVTVVARYDDGRAATPSLLTVDGLQVAPTGFDARPGPHVFALRVPDANAAGGPFEVPECGAADCPPVRLDVTLTRLAPTRVAPLVVLGTGAATVLGGLLAGAAAFSAQAEIDGYTTKVDEEIPIDTLIERRDERAHLADLLVGTGAVVAVGGLLWYWLGED